jgi:hypothetical protein
MKDKNPKKNPEIGKWEFWKVSQKGIELYPHMVALRITPSNNLVARYVDRLGTPKLFYIPEEYWNSSSSPLWFPTINKPYGFFIRHKQIPLTKTEELALIELLNRPRN